MKNQHLINGKKLTKKQLRVIAGGMLDCMQPVICNDPPCEPSGSMCTTISPACAQKQCRP